MTRHAEGPAKRRGPAKFLLAIGLIGGSVLAAYEFDPFRAHPSAQAQRPTPPRSPSSVTTTRTKCLCAKSFEDLSTLTENTGGDAESGPLSTGRVVWLKAGTSIRPFDADNGITTVLVESGDSSGERCHLLTKFVE
jgi:hypothetical protein